MSSAPRPSGRRRSFAHLAFGALFGVLLALASIARAGAQEAEATPMPVGGGVAGYGVTDWINLILRLGLVLIVIWFAIIAMRWWVRRMNGVASGAGSHLQIVETRSLGPNRSLQLVRVGSRAVLLGVTNERISAVLEIEDPVEVERLTRPIETDAPPTSFSDAASRLGSLIRWRPVIERRRSTPKTAPQTGHTPIAGAGVRPVMTVAPAPRSRWLTLARRVIGLEDPPVRRAPAPAMTRRVTPVATARTPRTTPAGRAPLDMTSASAAAAELPPSRAVRARSGYRQNQIAEAQRAIASVRAGMGR